MSRSTSRRRVTNGSCGRQPGRVGRFAVARLPEAAPAGVGVEELEAETGARKSGSSMIGISAIHPWRRYSPSVTASIPALSWSAIASSTARSSAARSSSGADRARPAASLASRRYSGRSRLPTTSARMVAVTGATIRSPACARSKAGSPSSPEAEAVRLGLARASTAATEIWDKVITTDLRAPFLCTREAFKIMKKQGGGRIINIASISAFRPRQNNAPYRPRQKRVW